LVVEKSVRAAAHLPKNCGRFSNRKASGFAGLWGYQMRVKANGVSINYEVDGPRGAPWLVLSNSLATNLGMWDDQAREFARSLRVLRYDQRGHGKSDAPGGRYTFAQLISDAIALMNALAIEKAHFVGLSMGGATALGLAQLHPDRLDKVVVCDSACQSTPATAQQWEERIGVAEKQGMDALVEPTVTRWFPPELVEAKAPHIDKVRQMIRTTPVAGFIGCAAALASHNYAAKVGAVKRPVLFLVGEKDGVTPAAMAKLHEALPGSRYVELAGAGHISNLDQPAAFNRAVSGFLAGR
jgi:3-oxoadipate enol-lactonase